VAQLLIESSLDSANPSHQFDGVDFANIAAVTTFMRILIPCETIRCAARPQRECIFPQVKRPGFLPDPFFQTDTIYLTSIFRRDELPGSLVPVAGIRRARR
jgi:hypothetical protein